jgi:hypothetical protein
MVRGSCDLCNWETQNINPAQVARNIAFHKSKVHGIKGRFATPEGKRIAARERYFRMKGLSPKEIQKRMDEYNAKRAAKGTYLDTNPNGAEGSIVPAGAVERRKPAKITEAIEMVFICPRCHCRVYVAEH